LGKLDRSSIQRIYELRVGNELRFGVHRTRSAESIAQSLRRGIEDDVAEDAASYAATIIKREIPPEPWRREDFNLIIGNFRKDAGAWRDFLRLNGILIRAAKEAWQVDQVAPGCAFTGLTLMLVSAYPSQTQSDRRFMFVTQVLSTRFLVYQPRGTDPREYDFRS
jgi:hypothetical protein